MKGSIQHSKLGFFLAFLTIVWAGCSVERPKDILSEQLMQDILYDYHIAKAYTEQNTVFNGLENIYFARNIYNKYGVTEEQFDKAWMWYSRHTQELTKVYEQIHVRLLKEKKLLGEQIEFRDKKPLPSAKGDSINVWPWQTMMRLDGTVFSNEYQFLLPSDSNFENRDTLIWQLTCHYLVNQPDSTHAALMMMQVEYEEDTTISKVAPIYVDGLHQIGIQGDSLGKIKEIRGELYYPAHNVDDVLLIDHIKLMRYHKKEAIHVEKSVDNAEE